MARNAGRSSTAGSKSGLTVTTYRGDAKTLLAFNLPDRRSTTNLAGFTVQVEPPGCPAYYLFNRLQFEHPSDHAQVATEPTYSSVNAPIHKFRWLHIPGSSRTTKRVDGEYIYRVTPRFFDGNQSLLPMDPAQTIETKVEVAPAKVKGLELGFTRGFVQSQAFADHFGIKAPLRPAGKDLIYDTHQIAGKNAQGKSFEFEDQYAWSGFTARVKIFELLDKVLADKKLHLDVFAYDLSETHVVDALLKLAAQGRVRIILDNAALHKSTAKKAAPEDLFEKTFNKKKKSGAEIKRGRFGRYSHDKVLIVSNKSGPQIVLTGSTNFSVTGVYVNSNHVLVFNDPNVASKYQEVFDSAWAGEVKLKAFVQDPLSQKAFDASSKLTPTTKIAFSPHDSATATRVLGDLVARIQQEAKTTNGSLLFAVMVLDVKDTKKLTAQEANPVYFELSKLHENEDIFSYGISDTTSGIKLYSPRSKKGVLVTGKPGSTSLPKPFNEIKQVGGGHQVHHKFVVCGFNGKNPVVYCGSSNLALGGEANNGDNLIAVHDRDVATVFALEALSLVDHFDFLDKAKSPAKKPPAKKLASKRELAKQASWFLGTTDAWVNSYYDKDDLHCVDRLLFGSPKAP